MQKQLPYERVAIDSLKLDPRNARKHDKKNLKAIKDSLLKFGQQTTIVVTKDNVVIAGNGTVAAAKDLGWETIDITRSQLTGEDAIAYGLVDNRASELAEWDDDNLKGLLSELSDSGWDLAGLGWDNEDLEGILEAPQVEGLTDEDDVPEVEQNVFGVKLGDIWQLGNHRLMCGDSTDRATVEKLMNGEKADMVFTDPPYGMNFDAEAFGKKNIEGDDKPFDASFILEFFKYCELIFLWGADYYCESLGRKWPDLGSWIIWDKCKEDGVDTDWSGRQGSEFETCWSKKKIQRKIVRALPRIGFFAKGDESRIHPTQKPVVLVEKFFDGWGKGQNLIADLFLGSGSTLIACEKTGRKCYGMELDPHYCSVIIKRWQDFTGKEAVKL